jgi:hypothetical protein
MSQLSLPFSFPQDRGRLNALQNILLATGDELRRREPVIEGIIDFTVSQFPSILRNNTPLNILSASASNPTQVSPYPFNLLDLIQVPNRPQVFQNIGDLIQNLPITNLLSPLQDVELIGIDESQVDSPLPQSSLTFLKSIAFRMYKLPDGTLDEAVGPIMSGMRMQLNDTASFEAENRLLSYIRNIFIAYISALAALSYGRKPFIVLHGPLIRAIGGFTHLYFDYQTLSDLLNIDSDQVGEFSFPRGRPISIPQGKRVNIEYNLPLVPSDAANGRENLNKFDEFCRRNCRECIQDPNARQRERKYRGFSLYLWALRSLIDLCRLTGSTVVSVVEDVSRATEMTRLILPSLLALPGVRQQIESSALQTALRTVGIRYPDQSYRGELYQKAKITVERLHLSDSTLFSYALAEGQYTAPVQIYRYRTRNTFTEVLNDPEWGIHNDFEPILNAILPSASSVSHPGYQVLMSYVRTTPLREPIRVEYFDLPHLTHEQLIGATYLLSLPYQEYGIPMILYYADKLARTPTQLVRAIIEREYYDLLLKRRFSDPVEIMRVLGKLNRNYLQREGI